MNLSSSPYLGILRGITDEMISPLIDIVSESNLKNIEITMNTNQADYLINVLRKSLKNDVSIGAGTVLNLKQLNTALDAGAEFIVMPVIIEEVINECVKRKIPVFPGALTPNEVYNAWQLGATMVKVFPAKFFGPTYFKELKAPMDDVKLMAVGGISKDTVKDYFKNGADAVAFGANVFKLELMHQGHIQPIVQMIKDIIS